MSSNEIWPAIEQRKLMKVKESWCHLTGHPAVAEVFEDNDSLAHPQEQLCLVFGKMGADHSDSGFTSSKVNKLTKLKLGKLTRSIRAVQEQEDG